MVLNATSSMYVLMMYCVLCLLQTVLLQNRKQGQEGKYCVMCEREIALDEDGNGTHVYLHV